MSKIESLGLLFTTLCCVPMSISCAPSDETGTRTTSNEAAPPSDTGVGPTTDGSVVEDAARATGDARQNLDASRADHVGAADDAPSSPVTFPATDAIILNPERGFYATTNLATARNLMSVRASGRSLVYAAVHLDAYLGTNHAQDLPASLLVDVQSGFDAVRQAGLKTVLRFQYDNGEGFPNGANDATEAWMIRHIEQLAPILAKNEDVIYVVQAGFIGAWGEWHTSLNFQDGPVGAGPRKHVLDALLAAVPRSRRVALRLPAYKRMFYGTSATTEEQLLAGADVGRVGHHNDCFVSSADDSGTYQYEPIDVLKAYLADDTKYEPIGGETCAVDPRNSCATTTAEMARFHWTHINGEYNLDVIGRWTTEGCRPDIERKLGYRLALQSASLPTSMRPGGTFVLDVSLVNNGYAAPTNTRPVFVALDGQGQRLTAQIPVDPRVWLPGPFRILVHMRVPATLQAGAYRLALWLPDEASPLRSRPEYSIELANQGTWNAARGDNTLLAQLTVTADAPGGSDPAATDFAVIP